VSRKSRTGEDAESSIVRALREQLRADEIVMTGVRLTDAREGDVEIDILVLFPDLGAAVIEVKGGAVRVENGQWTTGRRAHRRRINPIEQVRRGKHALRRYLDRQAEWQRPLLRTEWFIVLPQTQVTGDLGPEGHRDHVIGRDDLDGMRDRLRAVLFSPLNSEPIPAPGWEHDVITLLMRSSPSAAASGRRRSKHLIAVAAGVVAVAVGSLAIWGVAASRIDPGSPEGPSQGPPAVTGECHPDYDPCLPVQDDLDCSQVQTAVTVRSPDPYDLDRDGDGLGCEGGTG